MSTTKVLMNHQGNLGYGPDQVQGMTLADLLAEVEDAISLYGEDAEVVTQQTNNYRGANYGSLCSRELFERAEDEDEEAEDERHRPRRGQRFTHNHFLHPDDRHLPAKQSRKAVMVITRVTKYRVYYSYDADLTPTRGRWYMLREFWQHTYGAASRLVEAPGAP